MSGTLPATYVKGFHDEEKVRRMEYRKLGKTGLEVSKISFGGGALCANYGFDLEEGIKTVQDALKSGINYIDTAPWYGQGRSEEVLGQALKDVPRESYYIATKNLGVISAAAHGLGLLTNAGPPPWHPATDEQKALGRKAAAVCLQRGVELGKLALYYSMKLGEVSTFLTGMQTRQLLQINLAAFEQGLTEKEQEVLLYLSKNVLTKSFNWEGIELERYWAAIKNK
ncbi:GL21588 [Drosophila persimilis]|uniref:GL21588 n=1 Tax=Drosophila persimilis TaxID=7234 RepID=B4GFP9_DROPE|nr:GL21588 [Drosophila persimilis]